jgi:citrate synthase
MVFESGQRGTDDVFESGQRGTDDVTTRLRAVVAQALQIREETIFDGLGYRLISEWDSLAHVGLMLDLEREFGVSIDTDTVATLDSFGTIELYVRNSLGEAPPEPPATPGTSEGPPPATPPAIERGLAGVYFDTTEIASIDGQRGELLYRGYDIQDLVACSSFEETAYLLLHGALPDAAELASFDAELRAARAVPDAVLDVIRPLRHAHPSEVLRTAVSALASLEDSPPDASPAADLQRVIRLTAQVPTLVAAHHALRRDRSPVAPDPELSHAANYLWMVNQTRPSERAARIVDRVFILHADHGANASTFAARVAASTGSDVYAALTAAIATFSGPLHGGAIEHVLTLVREIGRPERAAAYIRELRANHKVVMGFGHRVYRTEDPRSRYLQTAARELSYELGQPDLIEILDAVVEAMRPYSEKGVGVNVDFYAGVIYRLLDLPQDLFVPSFAVGRTPGWLAQLQEQYANNIVIRPLQHYVGPRRRPYPQLAERGKAGSPESASLAARV